MRWNWQQPDWPEFTWTAKRLGRAEEQFLVSGGVILGSIEHLEEPNAQTLIVQTITDEAMTTSEIEGELLDRDSVQSSILSQLGLGADNRRVPPAEQGIAELMVALHREPTAPLSEEMLFEWHRMIMRGRRDLRDIGAWPTRTDPMQVVSGYIHDPKVHFEAPPSEQVPGEMDRFIDWFNRTAPGGSNPLPALTRAGLAHLYFVSIHPFEDGNGRIGRAISEKALAQSMRRPTLTALSVTILARRRDYYEALERANKRNEVTDWLAWFAGLTLEAQQRTQAHVDFILEKARLLDRLRGQINERQEKALLRMLREGPSGFKGGLSAGNYRSTTKASSATATRDLADLVDKGALYRTGEKKHTRYHLTIPPRPVARVEVDEAGNIVMREL